jgi:hypothetical protein
MKTIFEKKNNQHVLVHEIAIVIFLSSWRMEYHEFGTEDNSSEFTLHQNNSRKETTRTQSLCSHLL